MQIDPELFLTTERMSEEETPVDGNSGVRRKFSWGCLIQCHMMICIWCALFVTSQFEVIVMFPNQYFGEVCWHNIHIFLHPLLLFYVSLHWI